MMAASSNSKRSKAENAGHSIAVKVVKNQHRPKPSQKKTFKKIYTNPVRERLLWRIVIITAAVIIIFWALIFHANLTRKTTGDSLWTAIKNQVATVGEDFVTFFKSFSYDQTIRPEDQYKELEEKVFPPLPTSAESEQ